MSAPEPGKPAEKTPARAARPVPVPLAPGPAPGRSWRRWRLVATALVAAVGVVAAATTVRLIGVASPAVEVPVAGRLALLPFLNATGERSGDWVEWGLMEMVAEAVSRTAGVAMVSPDRMRSTLASST